MTRPLTRRGALALGTGFAAAAMLPGLAHAEPVIGDVVLGAEDAPVTVIEYASFTCPHCATFHIQTFPAIKEAYVDPGKVRFILREVYFDRFGLWASMVARCGGERGFYPISEQFMKQQDEWTRAEDPAEAIRRIGRINGLSNDQLDACLSDQDYARTLVERYQENAEADEVTSTPTFFVNGERHRGNMGVDEFSAILDAALAS